MTKNSVHELVLFASQGTLHPWVDGLEAHLYLTLPAFARTLCCTDKSLASMTKISCSTPVRTTDYCACQPQPSSLIVIILKMVGAMGLPPVFLP
jgi:hypothetical protein